MNSFNRPLPSSRLIFVLFGFLFLFGLVAIRLYFLQIVQHSFFVKRASEQYTTTLERPATRGTIFDRNGTPLTGTHQHLSGFIDRNNLKKPSETEQFLKEHFPLVYQELLTHPEQDIIWVVRAMNSTRHALLRECEDIHFMYEATRWYPHPATALATGFAHSQTPAMSGIERWYNETLAGTPSRISFQKEAGDSRHYFMHTVSQAGSPGSDVHISIDHHLTSLLARTLKQVGKKNNAACCGGIIIEPDTGQVLALAQTPLFNPNDPIASSSEARKNHLISTQHEWGSLLIPFTALAALAEGVTTPDELVNCDGMQGQVDGYAIKNDSSLGTVPFRSVVTHTNNVGIAKICKRLGHLLFDHLSRLGFTSPTGIELSPERSGYIPPPEHWSSTHLPRIAHGYEVMCNALHIVKALAMLTNGGHAIAPTLQLNTRVNRTMQLYDREPLNQMRRMLALRAEHDKVALAGYGLMTVGGKARTLRNGTYSKNHELHSYAGIIERGDYKRVILVFTQGKKEPKVSARDLFVQVATTTVVHEELSPPVCA